MKDWINPWVTTQKFLRHMKKGFVLSIHDEFRWNVGEGTSDMLIFASSAKLDDKLKFIHFIVQNSFLLHIDETVCYPIFILFWRGKYNMLNVSV